MKTNIEILLGEWGGWRRGENRSHLGYPEQSAFARMRVDGQRHVDPNVFLIDDDLRRVDEAIQKLHPDMRSVIVAHYVWIGPVKSKTERMRISRTVYYRHYEFAHKSLAAAMGGSYLVGYEQNYFVPTPCDHVGTQVA